MPCLLLQLWAASLFGAWAFVVRGFSETAGEADADRRRTARVALLLAAGPPTFVFLVTAFVLMQAAPTVQFNAGSTWALSLWSFWVHWWPAIFGCSGVQTAGYLVWFVGSLVVGCRPAVRYAVGFALLASVWGSLLLSMAFPSA